VAFFGLLLKICASLMGKKVFFTLENKVYGGLVFHASLISDVFVIIFVYSGGYVMSLLHGFPD